jgi:tripeptidyl-peptidase-1
MSRLSVALFVAALVVAASAARGVNRFFPERMAADRHISWNSVGVPDANDVLEVTFLLKIRDRAALERKFWTVSDPMHADYQNYMTLEEMSDFVRPAKEATDALEAFFVAHGIKDWKVVPNGDAYTVKASVRQVETMLNVAMERFASRVDATVQIVRSRTVYSLPRALRSVVDVVAGVSSFPSAKSFAKQASTAAQASRRAALQFGFVTPSVVQQELNIPAGTVGTNSGNLQAVAQFLGQYYSSQDLAAFQQQMQVPVQPVAKVLGPNVENDPGTEASLDIEYMMSTGRGVPTWFISTGGLHEGQEPFVTWATNLNTFTNLPWVNSVSYGDYENSVTTTYMDRLDVELMKLAARGSTILFSSGDDGVGCNSQCSKMVANWPASSPYVTAVGGVYGGRQNGWIADTIASGGFSSYYSRPSYQSSAVTRYLSSMAGNLPSASYYNSSNRAIPDLAAYSENVVVMVSGGETIVGGTSCASPIVGGLFGLINDKLLNAGKKPLGFLNQLLYTAYASNPAIFQKVLSGSNPDSCCPGFSANPNGGWCPVSGMGVPDYQALVNTIGRLLKVNL